MKESIQDVKKVSDNKRTTVRMTKYRRNVLTSYGVQERGDFDFDLRSRSCEQL